MIIVIGKSGQLAKELKESMSGNDIIFLGRNDINLFNEKDIFSTLKKFNPTKIINASAYTAVDKAETDIDSAFALNYKAVEYLATFCEQNKVKLIHISTDFVFDGNKSKPYKTTDTPNPINIYGKSKLAGEHAIQAVMSDNFSIIRTSWLYSSYGNNFVKTMIKLMNNLDEINVVSDQIGSPTHAKTLVELITTILYSNNTSHIYNCSDLGMISWYDFALQILNFGIKFGIIKKQVKLNKIKSDNFYTAAKRPKYSVLEVNTSTNKLWSENLEMFFEDGINKKFNF